MKRLKTFILSVLAILLLGCSSAWAQVKPLQVYILAGQSNMQGHAKLSTIEHVGMDPLTLPMYKRMLNAQGEPAMCERVYISALGCGKDDREEKTGKLTAGFGASAEKIGPEFTFGLYMEQLTDAPILIIKTAWGGKSLHTDFRSPSAGPYPFNAEQLAAMQKQGKDVAAAQAEKDKATGVYYRLMIEHVKHVLGDIKRVVPNYDAQQGYELAGFAWVQGWNDMVDGGTYPKRDQPGGYDAYSTALAHFIRDVRRDLNAPKLPFAIGVMGVGGPTANYGPDQMRYKATHQNFRDAMAAPGKLPEFQGTVTNVLMENYWDAELTAAKAKENALRQEAKKLVTAQQLKPAEENATFQKLRMEQLSERERKIIEVGISNFEFHYLGSAKILGGVGKGLAEALADLRKTK
jgi:alpha-galactosidase